MKLNKYFADLHIHIGRASSGQAVKITASDKLNFSNIAKESLERKGIDVVGIIDSASPDVIKDIEFMLNKNIMKELDEGGLLYKDELLIIPGAEIESREENGGQVHYLAYFPYLKNLKEFSEIMSQYITNINLSSQSTGLTGKEIFKITKVCSGILIPAHAFTPHKSFYGNAFSTYKEVFNEKQWNEIPAIELGLSADTKLADYLPELRNKSFLSNSDAHSIPKIAREYNIFKIKDLNFKEIKLALKRKKGRKTTKNFGMDPRLGKYHRSYCPECETIFSSDKTVDKCPVCESDKLITGVKDRVLDIIKEQESKSPSYRAEYIYQVPLLNLPGIGKKTLKKLLNEFGTEMEIIHNSKYENLKSIVGPKIADLILKARKGNLSIESGGGGNYGKVSE
ncbi:MAG TPA: endonuclease Q family protein [Halanaerobiales bacterium]|nr:endonuclease Q family protein [Halanaerobiales bacterium]